MFFFALGMTAGHFTNWSAALEQIDLSFYTLLALLFCVGFSIGNDPTTLQRFKAMNPRIALLPIGTILGTLSACLLLSIVLPHRPAPDVMAVGSGFAYYSLSSILITEYRGPELGTMALLCNIIRELFTLICAPLLVRWFGSLAPIAAGGATTMDTTLPIILRTSGQQYAIVSVFHGFVTDFSVPFLITFFCSL